MSWGHQHGLAFARQLKISLEAESGGLGELIEQVESFWRKELAPHFRDEEEILFPAASLKNSACQALVKRALDDHRNLCDYLQSLRSKLRVGESHQVLTEFADLLTSHIRFEERELFPLIETSLSPAVLDHIGALLGRPRV